MSYFQFGLLIGFILGALIMFIALVMILLYLGDWAEPNPPTGEPPVPWETLIDGETPSYPTTRTFKSRFRPWGKADLS